VICDLLHEQQRSQIFPLCIHENHLFWRKVMTIAINSLLTELTEEEGSSVQGGLGFFFNSPFFAPLTGTGAPAANSFAAQTNPLNYGFTSFFFDFGGVSGFANSTPGTTAPINPVGLDPTKINAALLQLLIK
jgi:hypothetical protein